MPSLSPLNVRGRSWWPVALLVCGMWSAAAIAADPPRHAGIWCTGKAEDGSCISIYELLADNTFAAYTLYTESETRYDIFGRWIEQPDKACFVQESWLLIDLAKDETVRSGELGMDTFYCNNIVESSDDTLVVTSPQGDTLITATRLDALPDWAKR